MERGAGKGEPGIKGELLVEEDVVGLGQSLEVGDPVLEDVLLLHEEEEVADEVMQELDEVLATVDLDGGEVLTYTLIDGKLRTLSQAIELFCGDGNDLQALFVLLGSLCICFSCKGSWLAFWTFLSVTA